MLPSSLKINSHSPQIPKTPGGPIKTNTLILLQVKTQGNRLVWAQELEVRSLYHPYTCSFKSQTSQCHYRLVVPCATLRYLVVFLVWPDGHSANLVWLREPSSLTRLYIGRRHIGTTFAFKDGGHNNNGLASQT